MQGDVHLDVRGEGVRALAEQVSDHSLVLVLAGPHQRGPASVVLDVNVVLWKVVGPE